MYSPVSTLHCKKSVQCYFVPEQCVPKISDVPTVWQYWPWVGLGSNNRPPNLTQTGLSRQLRDTKDTSVRDATSKRRTIQGIHRPRDASSTRRKETQRDGTNKTFRSYTYRSWTIYHVIEKIHQDLHTRGGFRGQTFHDHRRLSVSGQIADLGTQSL